MLPWGLNWEERAGKGLLSLPLEKTGEEEQASSSEAGSARRLSRSLAEGVRVT